jgi:hypothetical protein
MANILVSDLQPAGSGLFANSESFMSSMTDLSENELKTTLGGKKSKYGSGSNKGSNKGSRKGSNRGSGSHGSCGCGYGC